MFLISGTTGSKCKIIFLLDSSFIEEGYRLYNIKLRPINRSAQTGILRFTIEIFVYKSLLLVIGEIVNRNSIYLLLVAIG